MWRPAFCQWHLVNDLLNYTPCTYWRNPLFTSLLFLVPICSPQPMLYCHIRWRNKWYIYYNAFPDNGVRKLSNCSVHLFGLRIGNCGIDQSIPKSDAANSAENIKFAVDKFFHRGLNQWFRLRHDPFRNNRTAFPKARPLPNLKYQVLAF